jgi:hypothetical protein
MQQQAVFQTPGGIHVFNFFPIALADKANSRIHNFIVQAVAAGI